jgi:hypothetical protein
MKTHMLIISSKEDNSLIHEEEVEREEYCSDFKLDGKWLTEEEKNYGWSKYGDSYMFREDIKYLINSQFEKVVFTLEETKGQIK